MHHTLVAPRVLPATSRGARRWRRMRARIGLMAVWITLLVWATGASLRVPGEATVVSSPEAAVQPIPSLPHIDLERAAAWPRESADAWQAPSQESLRDTAREPSPEEEAALYIAGR